MVVFLGRHLPALLGLFKKQGEWVWLGGGGEEGSPTLPFARPLCTMGELKPWKGNRWGVRSIMRLDSPVCSRAFVQPLCSCLCLGPGCVWEVSLTLKTAAIGRDCLPPGVPTLYWVHPNISVPRGRASPPSSVCRRDVGSGKGGEVVPLEVGEHDQRNPV